MVTRLTLRDTANAKFAISFAGIRSSGPHGPTLPSRQAGLTADVAQTTHVRTSLRSSAAPDTMMTPASAPRAACCCPCYAIRTATNGDKTVRDAAEPLLLHKIC